MGIKEPCGKICTCNEIYVKEHISLSCGCDLLGSRIWKRIFRISLKKLLPKKCELSKYAFFSLEEWKSFYSFFLFFYSFSKTEQNPNNTSTIKQWTARQTHNRRSANIKTAGRPRRFNLIWLWFWFSNGDYKTVIGGCITELWRQEGKKKKQLLPDHQKQKWCLFECSPPFTGKRVLVLRLLYTVYSCMSTRLYHRSTRSLFHLFVPSDPQTHHCFPYHSLNSKSAMVQTGSSQPEAGRTHSRKWLFPKVTQ